MYFCGAPLGHKINTVVNSFAAFKFEDRIGIEWLFRELCKKLGYFETKYQKILNK